MVFKSTAALRKYLIRMTDTGKSLHAIQREQFPDAKVGTLSRIKNDLLYEPMHAELRAALHLAEICERCHRPLKIRRVRKEHRASKKTPLAAWWLSMMGNQHSDQILRSDED